jgi:methyl-accepting chemotaxis protein
MKLEAKLGSTYGILIAAMLVTSTVAYLRMSQLNRITGKFVTERVPVVECDRSARLSLGKSSLSLEEYLFFGAEPGTAAGYLNMYRGQWINTEKRMAYLRDVSNRFDLGEDNARIRSFVVQSAQLHELEDHIEALIESQKPADIAAARALMRGAMANQEGTLYETMYEVFLSENSAIGSESQQLVRASHVMVWTLWTATLVSALLGGLLGMTIARRISRGLRSVVGRATAIAEGDLTGLPLGIGNADEVGVLADAMQLMQSSLRETIGAVARTAASVTGNAVSIGATGIEMQHKMDEQNQQTELTATAMHEMSATVAEVSRHAGSAAQSARAAAETARLGGGIVREMLGSMNSIDEAVRSTSSTIHLLGEDSGRISHIVHVIEEIARKTNLLALNAAIEAARAGEHGRGFAVVASEVRALAESTAKATNEIGQMIGGIQKRTSLAVASMNEGTQTVAAGMVTTGSAGEALEQIIGMVEQVDRMIAQIAIASEQQSASAKESSSALNSIYQLGNENLRAMNTSVAGAEALRNSALDLEQQIERFRIGKGRGADDDSGASPELPGLFLKMISSS